jgi:hypothetical protein
LTILPPELQALTIDPAAILGGIGVSGTIKLSSIPASGCQVTVQTSNPNWAKPFESSITLTGQQTDFIISTSPNRAADSRDQPVKFTVNYGGITQTADLIVLADCNNNGVPDSSPSEPECDCPESRAVKTNDKDCNKNALPDTCDLLHGMSSDCDGNGEPDECQVDEIRKDLQGIDFFRNNRALVSYQSMISAYGRPWFWGTGQTPSAVADQLRGPQGPASKIRAIYFIKSCLPLALVRPILAEYHALEMLLGNEAFSDAVDSTVGDHIGIADSTKLFAFEGLPGINSLLDEELALLRGREIPLPPGSSFLDTEEPDGNYPIFHSTTIEDVVHTAVYNRLRPNASKVAYRSNYGIENVDDYDFAKKYPQGHGDAFGYYLTATQVYLSAFRGNPDDPAMEDADEFAKALIQAQPRDNELVDPGTPGGGDQVEVAYQGVRSMAHAMAARARAAVRIVDLTFRRDYREDPKDPDHEQVLADPVGARAWGTADWARRAGLGAYLDWAAVNQLLPVTSENPTQDLDDVHRGSVEEVGELAATVSQLQERVDKAGAGLNPLGLLQNVVPFGIDPGKLALRVSGQGGMSHYEQVREAATTAIANADQILKFANQAEQRLREQGETVNKFSDQVAESEASFTSKLIEIFGLPFEQDPANNDFDINTDPLGVKETQLPDLANFLIDETILARQLRKDVGSIMPRSAPGEIQLALSEVRVAEARGDTALLQLQALDAAIDDQVGFVKFLTGTAASEIRIIYNAGREQVALTEELKKLKSSCNFWCGIKKGASFIGTTAAVGVTCTVNPAACGFAVVGGSASVIGNIAADIDAAEKTIDEFDIEKRREQIATWKDAKLTEIRNAERLKGEELKLRDLIRQIPELSVNLVTQAELVSQAVGHLNAAIQRGYRLLQDRERIRNVQEKQLVQQRWKDLTFRVFRNSALAKYEVAFDLASFYAALAARSFAYEWPTWRFAIEKDLQEIIKASSLSRLRELISCLNSDFIGLETNSHFEALPDHWVDFPFSLRTNLLGLDRNSSEAAEDFRSFLEQRIVDRLEELPQMKDFAKLEEGDPGPAIVLRFSTEVSSVTNFFGKTADEFGFDSYLSSKNVKLLKCRVVFDGADMQSVNPNTGSQFVKIFLMPVGQSILTENDNQANLKTSPRPWAVFDQYIPQPTTELKLDDPTWSPIKTVQQGENSLNAIKRFDKVNAQTSFVTTDEPQCDVVPCISDLAGRSAWNSEWLLVIPGGQFVLGAIDRTSSSYRALVRERLRLFIYGKGGNPASGLGVRDIFWHINAYRN